MPRPYTDLLSLVITIVSIFPRYMGWWRLDVTPRASVFSCCGESAKGKEDSAYVFYALLVGSAHLYSLMHESRYRWLQPDRGVHWLIHQVRHLLFLMNDSWNACTSPELLLFDLKELSCRLPFWRFPPQKATARYAKTLKTINLYQLPMKHFQFTRTTAALLYIYL